jgi:lipopolysaccharide exporter
MSVATAIRVIAQITQLFVLARLLTPDDFGLMAMVMVVIVLGQALGDAGISNALIHYQNASRNEISSLYWLNILAATLVCVLVWLAVPLFVEFWHEPRLANLIRWALLALFVSPFGMQFQVLLEKELRFRRIAAIETCGALTSLVVGVATALTGSGVYSLVWALISQAAIKAVLLMASGLPRWRPQLRLKWGECSRFLRFGVFQMGDRVVNQFSSQMDKLMIGAIIGARPLGFYSVSHNLAVRPFVTINPAVTRVAFPVFSRVQSNDSQLRKGYIQVIELIGAVMFPLYTAIIVLAGPIIRIGPGPQWEPSIPLLQILGVSGLVLSLGNPIGSLLLAKGRVGMSLAINVVRIVLDAAAVWISAPHGITAVAFAILFVRLGVMFPLEFYVRWVLVGMRPGEYLAAIVPLFLAVVVMGGAMTALSWLVPWPAEIVRLVACVAAGGAVYATLMLTWQRQRTIRLWTLIRS